MANIKSSAKRDEKSKQLRAKNRADKTELKTMIKKFDAAVAETRTMQRTRSPLWLRSSTRWSKLYPLQRKGTLETRFPRPFGIFYGKNISPQV